MSSGVVMLIPFLIIYLPILAASIYVFILGIIKKITSQYASLF